MFCCHFHLSSYIVCHSIWHCFAVVTSAFVYGEELWWVFFTTAETAPSSTWGGRYSWSWWSKKRSCRGLASLPGSQLVGVCTMYTWLPAPSLYSWCECVHALENKCQQEFVIEALLKKITGLLGQQLHSHATKLTFELFFSYNLLSLEQLRWHTTKIRLLENI